MKEYDKYEELHEAFDKYNFLTPILAYEDNFFINLVTQYPPTTYDKNYDVLYLNSKEEKGKNLYEEFCKKYFYKGISEKEGVRVQFFPLVKMYLKKDGTRGIAFDYYETCLGMLTEPEVVRQMKDLEDSNEIFDLTKSFLQRKRSEINDVIRNGEQSPFYPELREFIESKNIPYSLNTLNKMVEHYTDLIISVNHMRANYKEGMDLNVEEFKKCFDIDKLYLIISKSIMDADLPVARKYHEMTPAYAQVKIYLETIKNNNLEGEYNPKIRFINPVTNQEEKYSFKDLKKDDEEMAKYADVNDFREISTDDIARMGLDKFENVKKYNEIVSTTPEGDILTDWDIIKPGEKQNEEDAPKKSRNVGTSSTDKKELSENEIVYRRFVLEKIPYSYQIVGKEKFAGYIGYVYQNGLVAFEKFYDDDTLKPVKYGNATYIMTIKNFADFTRLDKQQIMEYIKRTDNPDVTRLYHSKNWEQKLLRTINGVVYTDEAKMLIESIIAKQKENKKGM